MPLTLSEIKEISELFRRKEWDQFDKHSWSAEFNRLCELLNTVSDDEKLLLITLMNRFVWVRFDAYVTMLINVAKTYIAPKLASYDKVYVLPLVAPIDQGKAKSGTSMVYNFQHIVWPRINLGGHPTLQAFTDPKKFFDTKTPTKNDLIIALDDFVGTGDAAIDFLRDLNAHLTIPSANIHILALVGMSGALALIRGRGHQINVEIEVERGIDDNADLLDKTRAKYLMRRLEDTLDIQPIFRFGYKQSQALVTMARTPDNTFPVFWASKRTDGSSWPAPFPRYVGG